jgi:MFS family permease
MSTYFNKVVFVAACSGMLLFGVTLITLGSVAPGIQSKFGLDGSASGALFSILPFGIIFGSLLFGPFGDRFGYRVIMLLSCIMIFAGLEGIANASSLNILKLCVFFFGFGGGAINGATNALVSDISDENKRSANLSVLGVFFAVGALGVPLVLGMLEGYASTEAIITWTAYFTLLCAVFFLFVRFPKAKQHEGVAFGKMFGLAGDKFILLVSFFLVCQSGFEGIINNWTTLYLTNHSAVEMRWALFALSLYVAGMAVMRIFLGYMLRLIDPQMLLMFSLGLVLIGNALFAFSTGYPLLVTGMILIGAGLAAGYPVMLGFVGTRYADVSGAAFGLIISIALIGNMIINYAVGMVVDAYGIARVTTLPFVLTGFMFVLAYIIAKRFKNYKTHK